MRVSTSIMCVDFGRMAQDLALLNEFTDAYHWDIMDGHYVPNLALNLDMIASLRDDLKQPIHAHLMVTRPQDYVQQLLDLGVEEITFHLDTVNAQFFRLRNLIKDAGRKIGIVLNPVERPADLEYIIDELDSITVMTVDPGFAGQPFIQGMVKKIAQLQDLKQRKGYTYEIEVDGGVNQRTLAMLMEAGAERFVLGSSGLFNLGSTLEESIAIARSYIPFKQG